MAACHLDSNASPAQRACQLGAVLDSVDRSGVARALVGGDFNTSTYDISSTLALARDLLHKLLVTGLRTTIDQYMTPEKRAERPLFELLRARDFAVEGFNDRGTGTYFYDLTDPYVLDRARKLVGRALTRFLVRLLRPWGGRVPARLDWFAGRNVTPVAAAVERPPAAADGRPLSDHSAVIVDVAAAAAAPDDEQRGATRKKLNGVFAASPRFRWKPMALIWSSAQPSAASTVSLGFTRRAGRKQHADAARADRRPPSSQKAGRDVPHPRELRGERATGVVSFQIPVPANSRKSKTWAVQSATVSPLSGFGFVMRTKDTSVTRLELAPYPSAIGFAGAPSAPVWYARRSSMLEVAG